MVAFWRTFHYDGKISPAWWGWVVHALPLSLCPPSRAKFQARSSERADTFLLFLFYPYMYSVADTTPSCNVWLRGGIVGFCRSVHRKKRFSSSPSPAGMSLTKLPLSRNNSIMTSLFPPRESLVVTSRLGTGNSWTFFYGVLECSVCLNSGERSETSASASNMLSFSEDHCFLWNFKDAVILILSS